MTKGVGEATVLWMYDEKHLHLSVCILILLGDSKSWESPDEVDIV